MFSFPVPLLLCETVPFYRPPVVRACGPVLKDNLLVRVSSPEIVFKLVPIGLSLFFEEAPSPLLMTD